MKKMQRNWLAVSDLIWRIWKTLTWALKSVQNFHFNGLLLSKVYKFWAKKVQRSYPSWRWSVMRNLERNWLVVSKLTWGIWRILTQVFESLKHLHFNGPFLTRVYNIWAKKSTKEWCLIALKIDAKFERKLTCAFKNDIRNLASFHGLKYGDFILENKMVELK